MLLFLIVKVVDNSATVLIYLLIKLASQWKICLISINKDS